MTIEFPQQDGTLAPITLTPSSIDDYNTAISNLQSTVYQDNQNAANAQATVSTFAATATATTDEQNRLNYDLQNIGSAISSLNSDANFSSLFGQYQTISIRSRKIIKQNKMMQVVDAQTPAK